MEVTIRVMYRGMEIDRITRPLRMNGGHPAVTYRTRLWPVTDDCIHIEHEFTSTSAPQNTDASKWAVLVTELLPTQLPTHRNECSELLRNCFKEILPDGVVRAMSSLTSVGLELEARELLVDFLREKHDSERLFKLIQMLPPFSGSSKTHAHIISSTPVHGNTGPEINVDEVIEDEHISDWDWAPIDEISEPAVNDLPLREEAERIQQNIGTYRPSEQGAAIPNLNEPLDDLAWIQESPLSTQGSIPRPMENALVERTAKLGKIALDLLRYFADNPGDKASHAELVLGYPASDINKLLSGTLSHYLKRSGSAGWECQPWTHDVLTVLDEAE